MDDKYTVEFVRENVYVGLYFMWEVLESALNYFDDNMDRFSESEQKRLKVARDHVRRSSLAIFPVAYNGISMENGKNLKDTV